VTKRYLTYGMHSQADVTGRILETRDTGSRFEVTHRNAVLGRLTTPEEAAFLREPFSSF